MTVKNIHFIPTSPGTPVYELQDGTLLIPFANDKGGIFHYSLEQCLKGVSDQKTITKFREIYFTTQKEVDKTKIKVLSAVN